jgi:hypothetical protein
MEPSFRLNRANGNNFGLQNDIKQLRENLAFEGRILSIKKLFKIEKVVRGQETVIEPLSYYNSAPKMQN